MSDSRNSKTTTDSNSKPEPIFVIYYPYYSLSKLTEYGEIRFLANSLANDETPKLVNDFKDAHFFDTKEMAENTVTAWQNNFKSYKFFGYYFSVILLSGSESNYKNNFYFYN